MKSIVLAAMALSLSTVPGIAKDTQAAWQGFLTVTASTASCSGVGGAGVGDTNVSIYRPKILSTDTASSLSIIQTRAAQVFVNASDASNPQMRGTGSATGTMINGRAKLSSFASGFVSVTTAPSTIVASTANVTVKGTIQNFSNNTGCDITFQASYSKRLD